MITHFAIYWCLIFSTNYLTCSSVSVHKEHFSNNLYLNAATANAHLINNFIVTQHEHTLIQQHTKINKLQFAFSAAVHTHKTPEI